MSGPDRFVGPLEHLLGVPATDGNHAEILRNGVEIFPAMLDAIAAAERTIDFCTFIYWSGDIGDRFADALCEAAQRKVRTRVLVDALGSRRLHSSVLDRLQEAGAEVDRFHPLSWRLGRLPHRTHRKVLVCDRRVGFTGGVGIADQWDGDARRPDEWRDTHLRIEGPAVAGLTSAFVTNWVDTDNDLTVDEGEFPEIEGSGEHRVQIVRGGAGVGPSEMAVLLRSLIDLAEERVRIATAYFSPDEVFCELLGAVCERGVDVEVLLPGPHHDKRFVQLASEDDYEALLESGVSIWNFQPSMLHTKVLTVDGAVSVVGSTNVNRRSMAEDAEVAAVLFDVGLTAELDRHFDEDLERSEPLDLTRWRKRSPARRALQALTRPARSRM